MASLELQEEKTGWTREFLSIVSTFEEYILWSLIISKCLLTLEEMFVNICFPTLHLWNKCLFLPRISTYMKNCTSFSFLEFFSNSWFHKSYEKTFNMVAKTSKMLFFFWFCLDKIECKKKNCLCPALKIKCLVLVLNI